ncbi:MAG: hypothetical protein GY760_13545 [Deltaproteobacteria bacterium]|nr:hypothetical protein [Deltaproteobacteria bacterium]
MELSELNKYYEKFKLGEDNFHNLMQFRIKKILLISTFYDAYIFEHDSKLADQIVGEYHQLNLTTVPRIVRVSTGEEALERLKVEKFDLVITTMRIGAMTLPVLSKKIKKLKPDLHLILLLSVKSDSIIIQKNKNYMNYIDRIFLWNGDSKIFLGIIKYVEDKMNAPYDTTNGFVRVILLVEDSIDFYSIYLPLLYTEIMEQTQKLIIEELNDTNKYNRMRTRPKVLLATTYEEAIEISSTYGDYLLGIISDIEFTHKGKLRRQAGFRLHKEIKKMGHDTPFLLQSSDLSRKDLAEKEKIQFLYKKSYTLLKELHNFILSNLGFGDFVFRDSSGVEIGRAHNLDDFEKALPTIPLESILYHSEKNDFSSWLTAHGEFQIAIKLKPIKSTDFENITQLRNFLDDIFKEVRRGKNRGKIINFESGRIDQEHVVIRIGAGSLGGKGRGIAFFNTLLETIKLDQQFDEAKIKIPRTAIIGTSEFDNFISENGLFNIHEKALSDLEKKKLFLEGRLSNKLVKELKEILSIFVKPLAIRSSGLLEDSQSRPFAGVYQTYMLPNNDKDIETRLNSLVEAVKLVFVSVFLESAINYIDGLNYNIEEEKMGVIIQEVVGQQYENRYYPHFSGVAQSYNFYPVSNMKPEDGVAEIALGLGQSVVGGLKNYVFCPKYPGKSFESKEDIVKNSQTSFYSLDMKHSNGNLCKGEDETLEILGIDIAEKDGTLKHLASVWDNSNNRILDGISTPGPRVLNFANILKYNHFPFASILTEILDICEKSLGIAVEIEFAVDLAGNGHEIPTFYLLQVRPLSALSEEVNIDENDIDKDKVWLFSEECLGNGRISDIKNILYIDPDTFISTKTMEIQKEVIDFNKKMREKDEHYILIGPGRWGSRDKNLGIPVTWDQINRSRVIIETGLSDFDIEPSQGSHFFHNLIALNIGYFHIPYHKRDKSFIDWGWLKSLKYNKHGKYCSHIELSEPLKVIMDGKKRISKIDR